MNWEKSKALTPLKRDFLSSFFEEDQSFYLTGGSALGIFYLQHRLSYDLDFFTLDSADWRLLKNTVLRISESISAECRSITASPQFHRFELRRKDEREILDFVVEMVPQVDAKKESFGDIRVDTLREIMVSKICTLINRCEVKDLIDLFFLRKRGLEVADYFEDARRKEGGLDPAMISFILSRIRIDEVPEYVLEPLDISELRRFVRELQERLARMSFPE